MKRIADIRRELRTIPNALYELDPQEQERGNEPGLRTLWEENDDEADLAPDHEEGIAPIEEEDAGTGPTSVEELFEVGAEIDAEELEAALGGSEGEVIRRSVEVEGGTDALGWYVTFHAKGAQWGIHVRARGLLYLAGRVFLGLPADWQTKIRIAFRAIHQHELFHFAVDYMAAQWEMVTGKPCHHPARNLRDPRLLYILLEEELANAHMIRSFWGGPSGLKVRGRMEALRGFVGLQPEGYRDAGRSVSAPAFSKGCERLARRYIESIIGYDASRLTGMDLTQLYPLAPTIDWRYCPIHIVGDEGRLDLRPIDLSLFRAVVALRESDSFTRALSQLPSQIQTAWEEAKRKMTASIALNGLDFKQWERRPNETIYSVRLSKAHRAHLARSHRSGEWTAIEVGGHKQMGHG